MKTRKLDIVLNNELIKKDFEVPEFWSDRAALIVGSKYAMDYENSALDIIERVVIQIAYWGEQQGYWDTDSGPNGTGEFADKLRDILINQRASFNSPVWFNCGVPENSNQFSACFIFPLEDNMEDILDHVKREGMVFKSGSGAGCNVSKLRAKGEKLSNKGTASGPISFMRIYDANAGSIRSGGKNRRSAKMVCMDVDHPDIIEFIDCKMLEEKKAKVLIDGGVNPEEAYTTVAFQNTNHSIRVTDEYMKACQAGSNWDLINRGDKQIAKTLPAKDILMRAAGIAWNTGDPGIQYDDRMNMDNPVPSIDRINSTNPCSEFSAVDNSSCNLASLNLVKYWNGEKFNRDQFETDIEVLVTAMDILVDAAEYPTPEVREITTSTRPLGLGFSNLGAYLILREMPYDSEEARLEAAYITRTMTHCAYKHSIELAKKLGSFKAFEDNWQRTAEIAYRLTGDNCNIFDDIKTYGLRNSQLTLLAPTGTISFMMDCDTTGIEPLYALKTTKTLAGGGTIELVPDCINLAADSLAAKGNDIGIDIQKGINNLPEKQKAIFKTANEIHWKDHILMMAACQKHLNGAISKTVNMPADCTVQDIYDAYIFGWEQGLKALAIYRDGSKMIQPLTDAAKKEKPKECVHLEKENQWTPVRKKLSDTCYGPRHKFNIGGFKGYIKVSTYDDGVPGEIFITASKSGSTMQGILDSFATAISISLQYGVPLEKFIEKFTGTRFEPAGFTTNENIRFTSSIVDYIFRWMAQEFLDDIDEDEPEENVHCHTPPREVILDGPSCPHCGGLTQRSGTCYLCVTCGETTGCS